MILRRIIKSIILFYSTIIFLFSCNFVKGIQEDAQSSIISHKQFIRDISFAGLVGDLEYCNDCNFNKYQIIIDLKGLNVANIKLVNQSFPPYYTMTSGNKLNLSVNEKLYKRVQKGFEVLKKSNSDSIIVKGKSYELLGQIQYEWIPRSRHATSWWRSR